MPLHLVAETVAPFKAKKLAGAFLHAQGCKSVSVRQVDEPQFLTKASFYHPAYYVFEGERGGYVIIASDDRVKPLIGWSAEGSYRPENVPPNMRAWLNIWEDIVAAVKEGREAPQMDASQEWEALEKQRIPCYANEKQYETARWGQDDPYNIYCPKYNDESSATGCVATATAIVMRCHKWPEAGHGELPSYTYIDDEGIERSINGLALGNVYDWDNMPLNVNSGTSVESQKQIARLIADVAIMAQSSFYPSGTGAYPINAAAGLAEYFYYDASIVTFFKEYFTVEDWIAMLKNNLEDVGPIVYAGYSRDGGHAFVLDGYNSKGQFSINWGWGGAGNGFFTFPAFQGFNEGHQAVINMKKDEGGTHTDVLCIDGNGKGGGLTSETTEFEVGVPFDVSCEFIFNMSAHTFIGNFALAVVHRDGTIGEILDQTEVPFTLEPYYGEGLYSAELVITESINIGDHIRMFFSSETTPGWTPIPGNKEDEFFVPESIPIADSLYLDEATSFQYTAESGVLAITTKKDAEWCLADADGNEYTDGIDFTDGVLTINTRYYPLSSYLLMLTKGGDRKNIEFVFGSK